MVFNNYPNVHNLNTTTTCRKWERGREGAQAPVWRHTDAILKQTYQLEKGLNKYT